MHHARVGSPAASFGSRRNPYLHVADKDEVHKHRKAPANFLQAVVVVLTCGGYLAASSLLILLNKFLLSTDGFSFPLMLSGSGMALSFVGSIVLLQIPGVVAERQVITRDNYMRRILPLGFCSAATLALGNLAYIYLDVGLVQMLKSCCPVFVMLVAIGFRLERFTLPLVAAITLIAAGTATTAATGASSLSLLGLLVQFTSELCEAFRLCLAQVLMCSFKLHQFEALKAMSSACVAFLAIGVAALEWQRFKEERAWERVLAHPLWYLAAASLGFLLNILAFAVIKLTGSLTQKVLGTVKNVLLVIFCVLFLHEQVTVKQAVGYTASLAGFVWYQQQKMKQAADDTVVVENVKLQEEAEITHSPRWEQGHRRSKVVVGLR